MSAALINTSSETPDSPAVDTVGATVAPEPVTPADLAATQTEVVPDPPRDEAERIEPDSTGPVTLLSGQQIDVVPMKLRETMKLLKIVTRGAGSVLEQLMGDLNLEDSVQFAQTLGALVIMSIPEAEDEVIEFVQSMVRPHDFDNLPTADKVTQINALMKEFSNPELDDVITVVERVIRRESEDIRNLGKRLVTAFNLGKKVGEIQPASAAAK